MRTPLYNVTVEIVAKHRVETIMDCTPDAVASIKADPRYNVLNVELLSVSLEERMASVLSFYGRSGYID